MGKEVFLTDIIQLGLQGLDLKTVIDRISSTKLSRMTNVVRTELGALRLRPGQALLGHAVGAVVTPDPPPSTSAGRPFVVREALKGLQFGPPGEIGFDASLASEVRDLGVSMVRGTVTTFDAFDTFVDLFADKEVAVLGLFNQSLIPFQSPADWETEVYRQAFATRVRETVERYSSPLRAHHVRHWEIWSQPDADLSATGGADTRIEPEEFGALLVLVYPLIKAADPTATVVLGGISPQGHQFARSYLRDLYESPSITAYRNANGDHPWDALGLHPYPVTFLDPSLGLANVVNGFKAVMDTYGDRFKPVWVTELGWRTSEISESQQGDFLTSAYKILDTLTDPVFPVDPPYVARVFWYRYHDDAPPDLSGLVTSDLSRRKFSYESYLDLGSPGLSEPPGAPPVVVNPLSDVHSILRLNDPLGGVTSPAGTETISPPFTRILGIGRSIYHGLSGVFAHAVSGLSGDPLHLVPYRPALSSESWVYVGDRFKNVKIRSDGKVLPMGLAPPTTPAEIAHDTERRIPIEDFETAASWVGSAGTSTNVPGTGTAPGQSGPPTTPPGTPPGTPSPWPGIPPITELPFDPAEPTCAEPVSAADRDRIRAEILKVANIDTIHDAWAGPYFHEDSGHPDVKAALGDIGNRLEGLYKRPKLLRCEKESRSRALQWIASMFELEQKVAALGVSPDANSLPVGFTFTFYRGPTYTIRPTTDPDVQSQMLNFCRWATRLAGISGAEADATCKQKFPLGTVGVWDVPPIVTDGSGAPVPPGTVVDGSGSGGTETPPGSPGEADVTPGRAGNAVEFQTVKPSSPTGGSYFQYWGKNIGPIDLTEFPDGTKATDDDIVHLFIRVDHPEWIDEVRLYFGLGAFNNGHLPGRSLTENKNSYMKAFRPGDFVNFIEGLEAGASAAAGAANQPTFPPSIPTDQDRLISTVLPLLPLLLFGDLGLTLAGLVLTLLVLGILRQDDQERVREREDRRGAPVELTHGRDQWTEFGVIGVPLRRGDFLRIGDDANLGWRAITGLTVYVSVTDDANNVKVAFDELFLRGGSKLETIEPGLPNYDYRYIHVDPLTGDKSNPSPIMASSASLPSLRQTIRVNPLGSPRAGVIQWIYRRGGTLVDNWYFVGKTSGNGVFFFDEVSDVEALAAGTLEIDNDQPVTTVNAAGGTVRNQPLPSIWGPISDMLMGCGDRLRKGHVYWCKPGEPDSWPPQNNVEVCPPSEELLTGFVYGSESFVFSRERLYRLYPALTGETGQVSYAPTRCRKGPQERWMVAAGPTGSEGIFFIADDGIYRTDGGAATPISDAVIEDLFRGRERNGYLPISRTDRTKLRLTLHENELWFHYLDTAGDTRILVYDLVFDFWAAHRFSQQTASLYSEGPTHQSSLLLGGRGTGKVYVWSGGLDEDVPIVGTVRTGALDQGAPRREKVYGDLSLDLKGDPAAELTLKVLADDEATELAAVVVVPTEAKDRQVLDVFKSARRRNVSLDLSWTDPTLDLYYASVQYLIDEAVQRIRWESEETDHGIQAQQTPLYAYVAIRSTSEVLLQVTTYRMDGSSIVKTYTIPSTAEVKQQRFVPFEATKGVLFRYRFTASQPFQLYAEESSITVRGWDGQENVVKAFGDSLAVSPSEIRAVRGQTM